MFRTSSLALLFALLAAWGAGRAAAQVQAVEHSGWEFHHAGVVALPSQPARHGDPSIYTYAPPIPEPGPEWTPLTNSETNPRNPIDIDYLGPNDDYSSDLRSCLTEAEFAYFQSFVDVPKGFQVREARLKIGPLDDGARVVIFNSDHPEGVTPDGGYVLLGGTETADLSRYVKAGEVNRFVVQHVDDCAAQCWLGKVELVVNGAAVQNSTAPAMTWGRMKILYR